MTAKEKQKKFIKTYLKPTLKNFGYQATGQTWCQDKGDFFVLINLQNFSWNSKDNVDFYFNIGVALKAPMEDTKRPTVHDLTVYLREGFYLPDNRKEYKFKNNNGYKLSDQTNLNEFITELKLDFENYILPYLDKLKSLHDCLEYFGKITFWGDQLLKTIKENKLLMD